MWQSVKRPAYLAAGGLLVLVFGLSWWVRDRSVALPGLLLDAPGLFMCCVVALGLLLAVPGGQTRAQRRCWWLCLALLPLTGVLAWPVLVCGVLVAVWLVLAERPGRLVWAGAMLMLASGLLLGFRGAWRYDAVTAGAALDLWVFGCTLAALALMLCWQPGSDNRLGRLLQVALLILLLRLYTVGPLGQWWYLAMTGLGIGMLAWNLRTIWRAQPATAHWFLSLALLAWGLGSSAGIAAGCVALLCVVLPIRGAAMLPVSASFLVLWLVAGAAAAASAPALAMLIWLIGLLRTIGLWAMPAVSDHEMAWLRHSELIIGLGGTLLIGLLIAPVVAQLQGGLTTYGTLNTSIWLGLTMRDSGGREVATTMPLVLAGLLAVLMALLALRWPVQSSSEAHDPELDITALLVAVPWLKLIIGGRDESR